jgi:hypothetical protein
MQSMIFKPGNNPPLDSPNAPLFHTVDREKDKDYDANELRAMLMTEGLENMDKMNALKERCTNANLLLERKVQNLTQGYIGRMKGTKQIAYKHGFCGASCKLEAG